MDGTRGDKRTETSVQFHGIAVLRKEFFQKSCLVNRAFDSNYFSFDTRFVASVGKSSFIKFEGWDLGDEHVTIRHSIDLELFLRRIKFACKFRVDNNICKFLLKERLTFSDYDPKTPWYWNPRRKDVD